MAGVWMIVALLAVLIEEHVVLSDDDACDVREAVLASQAGDVQVLALVDLHGPGMDGQPCAVLDTDALIAMEAFVWMVRDINKEEVIPGIQMGKYLYRA